MIKKTLFISCLTVSITLCGCTKINDTIEYDINTEITGNNYNKLTYLLEGIIDIENDAANTRNKPLSTDEQKGTFIFNILNENYMNKYENPEEAPINPYYPILEDSFILNNGDIHDAVFPINENVKVAFNKSDIDKIMIDSIGDTLKDGSKIKQGGLILSGDKYLLFTYLYYGSDLIGNKGRTTRFEIDSINQASTKDIEIKAKYYDDILEVGEDYNESKCHLTFHLSENKNSFFGYTINEYKYTGCKLNENYIPVDLPSQIIYGLDDGIFNDYIGLKKEFRSSEKHIDLNNDGIEEFFRIGVDSPNGTQILGIAGNKGYNFIYDFSGNIVDEYNELKDGLFIDMYFENLDGGEDKEVIVAVGDKKKRSEINIYKIGGEEGFTKLGTINGKAYLEYYSESMRIHAPYSNYGLCQIYEVTDGKIYKI